MAQAALKKFLPSRFLTGGPNLQGFIQTLDVTNANLENLIQACIDQLFLQTASGRFLVQLGEQEGFLMPANSGLDINSYQVLVPIMISAPKQVRKTFEDLIEGFYGSSNTKPSIVSSITGPYNLNSGDDIILLTESGQVTIAINASQVSDITNVSALEIASIVNYSQNLVIADQLTDRTTNLEALRFTSTSSGPSAFVQILGGKLQNVLQFPKLIPTQNVAGTVWNLTKNSIYNDELTFTWNGVGTNPQVFLTQANDIVTIRGLADGIYPYSQLNGSYQIVDAGYSYFIVRNLGFNVLSASLTQSIANNIVFTKNSKVTIYDNSEFAITSETSYNTVTLTVPAVPPLARRFLQGSAHLHGIQAPVLGFTRSTIQIQIPTDFDQPLGNNFFLLSSATKRINFRDRYYQTVLVNTSSVDPIYTLNITDPLYAPLPYTTSALLENNPFYAEVDSADIIVTFPFDHGLEKTWGVTFASAIGAQNILSSDLNQEIQVAKVLNYTQVVININDSSGKPKLFQGYNWGPANIYQYSTLQNDGADFYLQFGSPSLALASGLTPGMRIKLDPSSGTDLNPYLANYLKYRYLEVVGISGSIVDLNAGFGLGVNGEVISGVSGFAPGSFGGSAVTEYLNTSSSLNQARVFNNLFATFLANTPSSNPNFVGSFIYDPTGLKTNITVSKFVTTLSSGVLRGQNLNSLFVGTVALADGTPFPQSGKIILDFGSGKLEGPITYSAIVSNGSTNQIIIDPSYKFLFTHSAGASVQYIYSNQPFTPDTLGSDYPVYLTGTNNARDVLFALAELLIAAGIFIQPEVILPNLRYSDTAIEPFA